MVCCSKSGGKNHCNSIYPSMCARVCKVLYDFGVIDSLQLQYHHSYTLPLSDMFAKMQLWHELRNYRLAGDCNETFHNWILRPYTSSTSLHSANFCTLKFGKKQIPIYVVRVCATIFRYMQIPMLFN